MSNILSLRNSEIVILEDLLEDLTGTFHVIAHTDEGTKVYIRDRQKYFETTYGPYLDSCTTHESYRILAAYDMLQRLLEGNPTPEEIIEQCEKALYCQLMEGMELEDLCDDDFERWVMPFEDYFLKE